MYEAHLQRKGEHFYGQQNEAYFEDSVEQKFLSLMFWHYNVPGSKVHTVLLKYNTSSWSFHEIIHNFFWVILRPWKWISQNSSTFQGSMQTQCTAMYTLFMWNDNKSRHTSQMSIGFFLRWRLWTRWNIFLLALLLLPMTVDVIFTGLVALVGLVSVLVKWTFCLVPLSILYFVCA